MLRAAVQSRRVQRSGRVALATVLVGALACVAPLCFARAQDAQPAPPQPPLVLLLDGLGVYVESDYVGVSALARPLRQQGFRTLTDSHLMSRTQGVQPDIIIGHSMGGDRALRYARQLVAAGRPAPVVITIDAAPAPPSCPVPRCINIHGPGFADVRGAQNVDAWASGARFVNHAQLPTAPVVQQIILNQTQSFMTARRGVRTTEEAAPDAGQGTGPRASAGAQAPTTATPPRMWTSPGWTVPGWSAPLPARREPAR